MQRLGLAGRLASAAPGRLRGLLIDAVVIVLSLGMLAGLGINPLFSLLGRPLADHVPLWFTVLCGLLSLSILAAQWLAERLSAE